jgi:hypothetical protein
MQKARQLTEQEIKDLKSSGYERRDADFGKIAKAGFFFFAFTLFSVALSWVAFINMKPQDLSIKSDRPLEYRVAPNAPKLQDNIAVKRDIANIRSTENLYLSNYSWIDKSKRVARIPIEHAMAIESQRASNKIKLESNKTPDKKDTKKKN